MALESAGPSGFRRHQRSSGEISPRANDWRSLRSPSIRGAAATRGMFEESYQSLLETFSNNEVLQALRSVHTLVVKGSVFEALKGIRGLFPIEDSILSECHGHELEIREAASCR